jgi:hypothetical protein
MNPKQMIDRYGKEFIKYMLDCFVIKKQLDNDKLRQLLINNGTITNRTSAVRGTTYKSDYSKYNGISIYNKRNSKIVDFVIYDKDIPELLEELA